MVSLDYQATEDKIVKSIKDASKRLKIAENVDNTFCPGSFIASQVLLTIMARIGRALEITIPESCYIFHDKKSHRQLTIKEATQKLLKEAKNG